MSGDIMIRYFSNLYQSNASNYEDLETNVAHDKHVAH